MKEKTQNWRVGVITFIVTLTWLLAVLCAVRVECAVGRTLHGTAQLPPRQIETRVNMSWLPPSLRTLIQVLQAERDAIGTLFQRLGNTE